MIYNDESLRSGWRWASLEDFAAKTPSSFVDGPFGSELKVSDLENKGIPLIRIQHIGVGSFRPGFSQFICERKFSELKKHDVVPGDLVFAKLGEPAGRSTLIPSNVPRGLIVADCVRLRIDPGKVEPRFLRWAVNSPTVLQQIGSASKGSTRQRANLSDFRKLRIPVPKNRDEQIQIAQVLEGADRLRSTRRYALELIDTFLPATFLDLFGSLSTQGVQSVEELAANKPSAIRTGPFGSQLLHSEFTASGIAVLGIDNAVNNRFEWSERRFVSPKKYQELGRYTVFPGDVIITIMGTCGRCAIVPDDIPTAINTKHLCCITLDRERCLPVYLHGAFLYHPFVRRQLGIATKGAIMDGLNMGIIEGLRIPFPPLSAQQHFATLVGRHERLRARQREALRQAEHFFQSLLHCAFKGVE